MIFFFLFVFVYVYEGSGFLTALLLLLELTLFFSCLLEFICSPSLWSSSICPRLYHLSSSPAIRGTCELYYNLFLRILSKFVTFALLNLSSDPALFRFPFFLSFLNPISHFCYSQFTFSIFTGTLRFRFVHYDYDYES